MHNRDAISIAEGEGAMEEEIDVRGLREALGWSQARLAKEAGVHQATICRAEHGQRVRGPLLRVLKDIRAAANVAAEDGASQ